MSKGKVLTIFLVLGGVILLYLILPKPTYQPAVWGDPIDGYVRMYQFSKYSVPDNYKFVSYMQSMPDRKKFVAFKNKETQQQIFIFILNELPKVKFEDVEISGTKIKRTIEYYTQKIRGDTNFSLMYLVPMLKRKDMKEEFPKSEVRGLKSTSRSRLETEKTDILLVEGSFNDLAFYRKSDSPFFKYPVPIFHSDQEMKGALAVINNKATGETIFAFGCNYSYKEFSKEEFVNIVRSITFDKEPKALFGTI